MSRIVLIYRLRFYVVPHAASDPRLRKTAGEGRSAPSDSGAAPSAHHKGRPQHERPRHPSFAAGSCRPPPTRAALSEPREPGKQVSGALAAHGSGNHDLRSVDADAGSRQTATVQLERHPEITRFAEVRLSAMGECRPAGRRNAELEQPSARGAIFGEVWLAPLVSFLRIRASSSDRS